jgi:hypothetical protein
MARTAFLPRRSSRPARLPCYKQAGAGLPGLWPQFRPAGLPGPHSGARPGLRPDRVRAERAGAGVAGEPDRRGARSGGRRANRPDGRSARRCDASLQRSGSHAGIARRRGRSGRLPLVARPWHRPCSLPARSRAAPPAAAGKTLQARVSPSPTPAAGPANPPADVPRRIVVALPSGEGTTTGPTTAREPSEANPSSGKGGRQPQQGGKDEDDKGKENHGRGNGHVKHGDTREDHSPGHGRHGNGNGQGKGKGLGKGEKH